MTPLKRTLEERFWEKVDRSGEHWLWQAGVDSDGYGQIWVDSKMRRARATRVVWKLTTGRFPHMPVLHRCDIPACVRPAHLFLGSIKTNNQDRARKGRSAVNINPQPGEKNGNAKLSAAQVHQIRNRVGERQIDIAKEFGVSQVLVSKIRRGEAWSHL